MRDPRVQSVAADAGTHAATTQTDPPWGLDRIDQRARPLDARVLLRHDRRPGVTVYVLDSGCGSPTRSSEGG